MKRQSFTLAFRAFLTLILAAPFLVNAQTDSLVVEWRDNLGNVIASAEAVPSTVTDALELRIAALEAAPGGFDPTPMQALIDALVAENALQAGAILALQNDIVNLTGLLAVENTTNSVQGFDILALQTVPPVPQAVLDLTQCYRTRLAPFRCEFATPIEGSQAGPLLP